MKVFIAFALVATALHSYSTEYQGSSFEEVWKVVNENPYQSLPQKSVTLGSFISRGVDLLQNSAHRTISNRSDLLPYFDKLLHPNGACLRGTWEIQRETPYSGFFKKDSKGLIVARASTTLSHTRRGNIRGFGLAGKIFPTLEANSVVQTANFFLIDNLGGTYQDHYFKAQLTNEPATVPTLSFSLLGLIRIALAAAKALGNADQNPGIRQVYPISHLALQGETVKTPKWMMVSGSPLERVSHQGDFREELREHIEINGELSFDLFVADRLLSSGAQDWQKIGRIIFDEIVATEGCDHRLHFHHPPFKTDLQ